MRRFPGGAFSMGSEQFYPEERPVRRVCVDPFWIDETPVTNAEFARFVAVTGCVTVAETAPDPGDFPGMPPEMATPGAAYSAYPKGKTACAAGPTHERNG